MKVRRLNAQGLASLGEFLDSLTTDSPLPYPLELLSNPSATESVEPEVEVEEVSFDSRLEAAEYLHTRLGDVGFADIERDAGLWSWLALFYFNELCPAGPDGGRQPGERARWIPAVGNFRKYYRHLLAGPFRIYKAHRDCPARAFALLRSPLHSPGEIVEQMASHQELVTNRGIVQAATSLYIDCTTQQPKRGAAGRGPGSARRLAEVFNQFDVTWDLYAMSATSIIEMLPSEFQKFMPKK